MHDLSLYLLDVLENSVRAGAATIAVEVAADRRTGILTISVDDDGPGLPVTADEALDPFFTTKKGKSTGLGLSLFRQAAEAAGGGLSVSRSTDLGGVAVRAWMDLANVDRPPLGDVATTIMMMVVTNPEVDLSVAVVDGDERLHLRGEQLPQRLPDLIARQKALA
jgi:hypothetical protein